MKRFLIQVAWLLLNIGVAFMIATAFNERDLRQTREVIAAMDERHRWAMDFDYVVDKIQIFYDSNVYEISAAENPEAFTELRAILNPFGRRTHGRDHGFVMEPRMDTRSLEKILQIVYFVEGGELFSVQVYLAPAEVALYGAVRQMVSRFNGLRGIVVLDRDGFFGAFGQVEICLEGTFGILDAAE